MLYVFIPDGVLGVPRVSELLNLPLFVTLIYVVFDIFALFFIS